MHIISHLIRSAQMKLIEEALDRQEELERMGMVDDNIDDEMIIKAAMDKLRREEGEGR